MRIRFVLALMLSGCGFGGASLSTGPGGIGATTGGQKDIGQAREVVASGAVPTAAMIVTEGLLAEHDFATEGDPCTERFCARPAVARMKSLATGKDELFVHVGMLANLGADWKRPPADIVVVIDKGSSMAGDLAEVAIAVNVLIDKLQPDDRLGVVVYDDTARTLIPLGTLTDKDAARAKVTALSANGGFQIMGGLELAFAAVDATRAEGRLSRVMLFTCGYPSAGAGPFADTVKKFAARGVGLSVFGVLLGFDAEMGRLMSTEYGGNFFFLDSLETVKQVFDADLDFVITPLAYDFKLALLPAPLVSVKQAWGIPGGSPKLEATTLFPSRNRGAIVLRLDAPAELTPEETGSLDFEYALSIGSAPIASTSPLLPATHNGVRKAAALVNMSDELSAALTLWSTGEKLGAQARVDALLVYLKAEATGLADPQFDKELTFVTDLRTNMK